ncbi:MAG: hypothetical protein JKY43_00420 [Phycisphaerales bacterium]|nr:hypothetical protein [Phycisphaerales bacterium]
MNNTIKALLGAALLTVVMSGCETMAERSANSPDGKACDTAKYSSDKKADCDKADKAGCDKADKAGCDKKSKAGCDKEAKAAKAACPSGKAAMKCGENCTKPCCA